MSTKEAFNLAQLNSPWAYTDALIYTPACACYQSSAQGIIKRQFNMLML